MPKAGSALKLERADRHLADAEAAASQFLAGKPYRLTRDEGSEPGKFRLWITLLEGPPELISLAAGDAVHNMRSALDHVVYEMSGKRKENPSDTSFPIQAKEEAWDKRTAGGARSVSSGLHKVRFLPDPAQALIHDLQPYDRPEPFGPDMFGPDRRRLKQLHDFDNADKHKNLNLAVAWVRHIAFGHDAPGVPFPDLEYRHRGPLELDTPTLLAQLSAPPPMGTESLVSLDVIFDDGKPPYECESVGDCLRELFECVRMILGELRRSA